VVLRAGTRPNPIRHLRYYADLIETDPAEEIRADGTNRSLVVREPVGVVGAITPWNGPLSSPAIEIGPALAAGCSVVLKPPPETPLAAYLLADAFAAAGLPEGVLSVLPGDREVGAHLVRHPQVDKIAFTGSTAAGRLVMKDLCPLTTSWPPVAVTVVVIALGPTRRRAR
jgi:aldehyde dehydrogenase (NAD+)